MKNALILSSLILLMACSKKQSVSTPVTATPPKPIYSQVNFAGTYNCTMTGTLDMTWVNSYPCHTGHRSLVDTFTCVIGKYSAVPGYCTMEADSIMGNPIYMTLTSNSTFTCWNFIYQPKGCAVGFCGLAYGSVSGNTITITHNKKCSDDNGTQDQKFVVTMVRQ